MNIKSCWWRTIFRPASISRYCADCMSGWRLDGIQAVQTLSRLNRAYAGPYGVKDTTYVPDFVNEGEDMLAAFQMYRETASLEDVTDPNPIYSLRAKLDAAAGYYDEPEMERLAAVELNPKSTQGEPIRALEPTADRLMRRFQGARERWMQVRERSVGIE